MRGEANAASAAPRMRLAAPAVLAGALTLLSACSNDRSAGALDSSLLRDLQLAGQISNQPTFQDTAVGEAPTPPPAARRKPAPTRSSSTPRRTPPVRVAQTPRPDPEPEHVAPSVAVAAAPSRSIPAGTGISMTSGSRICTSTNRPGDKIVATVDAPVTGSNGATIPAGSKVVLEVASVAASDQPAQSQIVFRVRALYVGDSSYDVAGDVTPTSPLETVKVAGSPNADKKKVIGGAIAGAILGQVLGHDTKSTVIGAATGAAAGTIAAKAGQRYEACLNPGSSLRLTLARTLAM